MTTIADLVGHVDYLIQDAPYSAVSNSIRRSVQRFMRESMAFTDTVLIRAQEGVKDYHLPIGECRIATHIISAKVTSNPCVNIVDAVWSTLSEVTDPTDPYGVDSSYGYWVEGLGETNTVVNLQQTPKKDSTLAVTYSWMLGSDSCDLPEQFSTIYLDYIIDGALHYLLSMGGYDWSDPKKANDHELRFNFGLNKARSDKKRRMSGALPMIGRPFLGGRRW